jgi:hypothetical protein
MNFASDNTIPCIDDVIWGLHILVINKLLVGPLL